MLLLVWNIERFTLKRIQDSKGKTAQDVLIAQAKSAGALAHIISTVRQADPDIFIVLEALSSPGDLGTLGEGKGKLGLLRLFTELRTLNANWFLVPAVRTNPTVLDSKSYTESVGVFWRNDRVQFIGPLKWPKAQGSNNPSPTGPAVPPTATNVATKYPAPWDGVMPTGTAANWAGYVPILPGSNPKPTIGDKPTIRQPFITDFTDGTRSNRIFSVHLPPNKTARESLVKILGLNQALWRPGHTTGVAIVGDMNIDLAHLDMLDSTYLTEMGQADFNRLGVYPLATPAYTTDTLARSMLKKTDEAVPTGYLADHLYDYGFLAASSAPPNYPAYPSVIADRVIDKTQAVNSTGQAPIRTFTGDMALNMEEISSSMDAEDFFRDFNNYGHIRYASDHIAALIQI